jgi:hypothetical protein
MTDTLSPSGLIQVDWITLSKAFLLWRRGKRQWLTKHIARFLATGRVMYRRKEWSHDHCPICDGSNEDSDHVKCAPRRRLVLNGACPLTNNTARGL